MTNTLLALLFIGVVSIHASPAQEGVCVDNYCKNGATCRPDSSEYVGYTCDCVAPWAAHDCGVWSQCGGDFNIGNGVYTLTSINFPAAYPNSQNCTYVLRAPEHARIDVEIDHLHTECGYDYLTFYEDIDGVSRTLLHRCGTLLSPDYVQSTFNVMRVVFTSDGDTSYSGWRFNYNIIGLNVDVCADNYCKNGGTCIPDSSQIVGYACQCEAPWTGHYCGVWSKCGGVFKATEERQIFTSNNFPHSSPPNLNCTYIIRATSGPVIAVVEAMYIDDSCSDPLKFYEDQPETRLLKTICGESYNIYIRTDDRQMRMVSTSDHDVYTPRWRIAYYTE